MDRAPDHTRHHLMPGTSESSAGSPDAQTGNRVSPASAADSVPNDVSSRPLSLIVPVYNEAENFPNLITQIEQHIPRPFEMYVVYDFDADTTVPVVRDLMTTRPWLHLVRNQLGRGVACALRAGFDAVESGPALVVMADLSDDLSIVPKMLDLYRQGNRVVCASRYMKGGRQIGGPWLKRTLSRTAGVLLCWLVRFPTHDATNNFRLYDAGLVSSLGIESSGGFEVALELTAKAYRCGVPIAEVPTTWRDRVAGQSRFKLFRWLPRYLRWYFVALGWSRARTLGRSSHRVPEKGGA